MLNEKKTVWKTVLSLVLICLLVLSTGGQAYAEGLASSNAVQPTTAVDDEALTHTTPAPSDSVPASENRSETPQTSDSPAASSQEDQESTSSAPAVQESKSSAAVRSAAAPESSEVVFDIAWTNAVSSGVTAYSYDDATDPNHTNLLFHPQTNSLLTATAGVSLKLNAPANKVYPAGSIKFTVPANLMHAWDGSTDVHYAGRGDYIYDPQLKWQIVKAPAQSSASDFNYVDNGDGTYTVSNYNALTGGTQFYFEQAFSFRPSHVKVDASGKTSESYQVTLDVQGQSQTKKLSVELQNKEKEMSVALKQDHLSTSKGIYYEWQDAWGAKPADADQYFYAVWFADAKRYSGATIPYTFTISQKDSDGELIGVKRYGLYENRTFGHQNYLDSYTNTAYTGIAQTGWEQQLTNPGMLEHLTSDVPREHWKKPFFVIGGDVDYHSSMRFAMLKRYPISLLDEARAQGIDLATQGITLHNEVALQETLSTGKRLPEKVATATAQVYVQNYTGYNTIWKSDARSTGWGLSNYGGYQTLLSQGQSVDVRLNTDSTFVTTAESQSLSEPSWDAASKTYTVKPYITEIEEGKPYLTRVTGFDYGQSFSKAQPQLTELADEDYSYKTVKITLTGHDGSKNSQNTWLLSNTANQDASKYPAVEVYARTAGTNTYTLYGKLSVVAFTGSTPVYKFETADGTQTSGNTITLPVNTVGLKYKFASSLFKTTISAATVLTLHPTDHVKGLVQADLAAKSNTLISTSATMSLIEQGKPAAQSTTYGQPTRQSSVVIGPLTVGTAIYKSVDSTVADKPATGMQDIRMRVAIHQNTSLLNSGYSQMEYFRKYVLSEGVFYDLLPAGTTVDPQSIDVRMGQWWGFKSLPRTNFEVSFEKNWQGSGQTMMIIKIKAPDSYVDVSKFTQHGCMVYLWYTLKNSYHNIADRGNTVVNTVAYHNTSGTITQDISSAFTNSGYVKRGYYSELIKDDPQNWMLAQTNITFNPVTVKQSGVIKKSANDHEQTYADECTEFVGGKYSYQLSYGTSNGTRADNLVLYDVLEQGSNAQASQWQGSFDSIDVSSIKAKDSWNYPGEKADPVVYYATKVPTKSELDISNTSVWSKEKPANPSDVKAIAIDVRKTNAGHEFSMDRGTIISAYVHMVAPAQPELAGKTAVNQTTAFARTFTGNEAGASDTTKTYDASAKVTLEALNLELHKSSDPATGTKDEPTVIAPTKDTPVTYTLSLTNTSTKLAAREIVLEDVIPEGMSVDIDAITLTSPALKLNNTLVKDATSVSVKLDGNKLVVTVPLLAVGGTLRLQVPTKLAADLIKTTRFENTARITSAEGRTQNIASETTYHKANKTYTLSYEVADDPTYGHPSISATSTTPNKVENIEYGSVQTLANPLSSSDTQANGQQGYWVFEGWKQQKQDSQSTTSVTITKDTTVYGAWKFIPTTNIPVSKQWVGLSQENRDKLSVLVRLYKNGKPTDMTQTLNKDNAFTSRFDNVRMSDDQGNKYVYTIKEEGVDVSGILQLDGKSFAVSYDSSKLQVTNTLVNPKIVVSGTKVWDDANNQDGVRPKSITVTLLANGQPTNHVATITKDQAQSFKFEGLDTYDQNGNTITYSVQESPTPGYTSSVEGTTQTGFTITNVHTPAKMSIPVTKNWVDNTNAQGLRPQNVTVRLLANGVEVAHTQLEADAQGTWAASFDDVAVNKDGQPIVYSVVEDSVEHYGAVYAGTADEGFTITNTIEGKRSIAVTKVWKGDEASSVKVTLLRDGNKLEDTTITKQDGWKHVFEDLDAYDASDGHEYVYTIEEVPLDGYTSQITGDAQTGFTLTNTQDSKPVVPAKPGASQHIVLPKTGDVNNTLLMLGIALGGLVLLAGAAQQKRQKETA